MVVLTIMKFMNFGEQVDVNAGEITSVLEILQGETLKDSFKRLIKISLLRLERRQKSTKSRINLCDQAQSSIQQSPQIQKPEDDEVEMKKSREDFESSRLETNLVDVDNIEPAGGASLLKRNQIWTWYWPCLKYCRSVWIRLASK